MTLYEEFSSWIGTVSMSTDPDSQSLARCMRKVLVELERCEADAKDANAKVMHDEMYGRRDSAPLRNVK